MIRHAIVLALTIGGAGLAHADASADSPGLFREYHFSYAHDPGPVREAARYMAKACAFSTHARIGPRPVDQAGCEKSEATLIAAGGDGARAALEILDDDQTASTSRYRLYDAVGRSGDAAMIAPLVAALEKLRSTRFAAREYESFNIVGALRTLSYASIGAPSPFHKYVEPTAREMAVAWSAWAKVHQGRTHRQLFDERVVDAKAHLADRDAATAYDAATFLAANQPTHADGVAALKDLAARAGLTPAQRSMVENATHLPTAPAPSDTEGRV